MKGILMRSEMVKALPKGKILTTRIEKSLAEINENPDGWALVGTIGRGFEFRASFGGELKIISVKPRYQPGETVFVKEGIRRNDEGLFDGLARYQADNSPVMFLQSANRFHWRWQRDKLSGMFLPEEAARYHLKILSATPVRLKSMTNQNAIAEGFHCLHEFIIYFTAMHPEAWERNEWGIQYGIKLLEKVDATM